MVVSQQLPSNKTTPMSRSPKHKRQTNSTVLLKIGVCLLSDCRELIQTASTGRSSRSRLQSPGRTVRPVEHRLTPGQATVSGSGKNSDDGDGVAAAAGTLRAGRASTTTGCSSR